MGSDLKTKMSITKKYINLQHGYQSSVAADHQPQNSPISIFYSGYNITYSPHFLLNMPMVYTDNSPDEAQHFVCCFQEGFFVLSVHSSLLWMGV